MSAVWRLFALIMSAVWRLFAPWVEYLAADRLYLAFIALRFLFALAPGYIHPDEFFQSQEITAGNLFNLQYFVPWEFDPSFPARSIIFPALSTGVWYKLFSTFCNVSAWFLFVVPRLATFFYSLLLDLCALHICTNLQIHQKGVLRTLATSWTMLVFHTRPFSNTFESVLVALTLALPATLSADTRNVDASINRRAFSFGLLMAVGSFTRITYPGFAAPIGLYFLAAADFQRRKVGTRVMSMLERFALTFFTALRVAVSFALFVAVFIVIDSIYFGKLKLGDATLSVSSLVVAPFNNLLYNMDPANLALHGIHPRYMHLLVNLPMLYTVLPVVVLLGLWFGPRKLFALNSVYLSPSSHTSASSSISFSQLLLTLYFILVVSMGILSSAPHQEARFLVPLMLPLALLTGNTLFPAAGSSALIKVLQVVWFVSCVPLSLLFGVAHQGGVLPSLIHFSDLHHQQAATALHTELIYYRTYMPPRTILHLSAQQPSKMKIVDLASANIQTLTDSIRNITNTRRVFVMAPASLKTEVVDSLNQISQSSTSSCRVSAPSVYQSFWPHFSGEDAPQSLTDLALDAFEFSIECPSN